MGLSLQVRLGSVSVVAKFLTSLQLLNDEISVK